MANELEIKRESSPQRSDYGSRNFDVDDLWNRFFGNRFGSFFGDAMPAWPSINRRATMDLQETNDAYCLTAEVPGIPKEDIHIDLSGNVLSIRAEHQEESGKADSDEGYQRQYRRFSQSLTLPESVDFDKIEAHCENGLLEVVIPKTERKTEGKKIEVQSGKGGFLNRILGKEEASAPKSKDVKH